MGAGVTIFPEIWVCGIPIFGDTHFYVTPVTMALKTLFQFSLTVVSCSFYKAGLLLACESKGNRAIQD